MQNSRYYLIEKNPNDNKLPNFYTKYQLNKEHFDWILNIIPLSRFRAILNYSYWTLFIILMIYYLTSGIVKFNNAQDIIAAIGASVVISGLTTHGVIGFFIKKIRNYYYRHLIKNIIK